MLIQAKMPSFLWAEAVQHSVWLRNCTYTSSLPKSKTPYEMATGIKPDLTSLLEWGSKVRVKKLNAQKLQPQALEATFMDIDDESKGYRIYWPTHRKISIEQDVYPDKSAALAPETVQIEGENVPENVPEPKIVNPNDSESTSTTPEVEKPAENEQNTQLDDQNSPEIPTQSKIPFPHEQIISNDDQAATPRRGTCTRKPAGYYNENQLQKAGEAHLATVDKDLLDSGGVEFMLVADKQDWFHELVEEALTANPEDTPSVHEALNGPEKDKWLEAMGEEFKQITKVETFTIVEAPPNTNIINGKWVLRQKRNGEGKVIRWKARYIVRGFQQRSGTDFTETFAPTVQPTTLRILLAVAAQRGATVVQAQALRDEKARSIALWLYEDILCRWGTLRTIVTDNGESFRAALKWIEIKWGIKHITISAYNSQANGAIERPHWDICQMLYKATGANNTSKWYWFLHTVSRHQLSLSKYAYSWRTTLILSKLLYLSSPSAEALVNIHLILPPLELIVGYTEIPSLHLRASQIVRDLTPVICVFCTHITDG